MRMLVPLAAMLMLVLAGVIYAAGQMMGAETRARANVWATACLTGALIGILIVVVAPPVFASLLDPSMRTASGGLPCSYEDLAEIGVVCEGLGEAG